MNIVLTKAGKRKPITINTDIETSVKVCPC